MGFDYTDLPLVGRRDPENGLVYFGTVVNGVFVKLAVRKIGGLDADIATAAAVASGTWKPQPSTDHNPPNTVLPHIVLPVASTAATHTVSPPLVGPPPVEGTPADAAADAGTGEDTTLDHDG